MHLKVVKSVEMTDENKGEINIHSSFSPGQCEKHHGSTGSDGYCALGFNLFVHFKYGSLNMIHSICDTFKNLIKIEVYFCI